MNELNLENEQNAKKKKKVVKIIAGIGLAAVLTTGFAPIPGVYNFGSMISRQAIINQMNEQVNKAYSPTEQQVTKYTYEEMTPMIRYWNIDENTRSNLPEYILDKTADYENGTTYTETIYYFQPESYFQEMPEFDKTSENGLKSSRKFIESKIFQSKWWTLRLKKDSTLVYSATPFVDGYKLIGPANEGKVFAYLLNDELKIGNIEEIAMLKAKNIKIQELGLYNLELAEKYHLYEKYYVKNKMSYYELLNEAKENNVYELLSEAKEYNESKENNEGKENNGTITPKK